MRVTILSAKIQLFSDICKLFFLFFAKKCLSLHYCRFEYFLLTLSADYSYRQNKYTYMKKLLILLLSALSLTAVAQQKKVDVYVKGQQTGINKVLGDQLVAAFAKSGKYIAIERTASFLAELGKEQNYQRTGAVDDNELSRLGKQFGVQLVCVADVSDVFGEKYVSTRLIDVESAEVVNTSNATSKLESMQELLKVTEGLAKELTAKTVQEKAAEAAAKQKEKEDEIQRLRNAVTAGYIQIDNIMFVIVNNPPHMTYNAALEEAKRTSIGGFLDWRLPTTSELLRVLNVSEEYSHIYDKFPNYNQKYAGACDCYWGYGRIRYWCANKYWYTDGKLEQGNTNCRHNVLLVRDAK